MVKKINKSIMRQPFSVSIKELMDLANELKQQSIDLEKIAGYRGVKYREEKKWQVNIKRKTKFDNWEFEK